MKRVSVAEILRECYMKELKITQKELAIALDVAPSTLTRLLSGKSSCSTEMAIRLSKVFTTSPKFWLNLQRACDLDNAGVDLSKVKVLWEGTVDED